MQEKEIVQNSFRMRLITYFKIKVWKFLYSLVAMEKKLKMTNEQEELNNEQQFDISTHAPKK